MNYRYWLVCYGADCTETGMTMNRAYIRTLWTGYASHDSDADAMLRDFCRERFGKEVAYVQGVAPCRNWTIHASNHEEWIAAKPQLWGGYPTTVLRMTIAFQKGGKAVLELDEKDPKGPPKPTYADLERENAELRAKATASAGSET